MRELGTSIESMPWWKKPPIPSATAGYIRFKNGIPTNEAILDLTAESYNMTRKQLTDPGRLPVVVEARRNGMRLLDECGRGCSHIGRLVSRDHSTVLYHIAMSQLIEWCVRFDKIGGEQFNTSYGESEWSSENEMLNELRENAGMTVDPQKLRMYLSSTNRVLPLTQALNQP